MDPERTSMPNKLEQLNGLKKRACLGGGEKRIRSQHERGKLTARERLAILLDKDSFEEFGVFAIRRTNGTGWEDEGCLSDAVVTGSGKIDGRQVFVYAQDFTVAGGSVSEAVGLKIKQLIHLAMGNLAPVIAIFDSGGARIQDGVTSLAGVGDMLCAHALASGVVPQISIVAGPAAGGAAYGPALTDFTFVIQGISQMYITGPDAVKAATHEEIDHQDLGGALVHTNQSGVAHFIADTEELCYLEVRRLLSFLPQSWKENPPQHSSSDDPMRTDASLRTIIPELPGKPYDIKMVVNSIADDGKFLEVHQRYAPNILVGFARMGGQTVGIVAQQPSVLAGAIDINAADKAARFIRCCDAFNIPLVSLVDVPGFLPGSAQEHNGIIRHGAKLIFAYAEATVPKISVILRKAYGGAYIVMGSKHLRGDINYAWPEAEIAVMGASGAVSIISRRALAAAADPESERRKLVSAYEEKFNNPYAAAAQGYIDDVIDPAETRPKIIRALEMLGKKVQINPLCKHSSIPL